MTIEQIDKAIVQYIRDYLVRTGYLPDALAYSDASEFKAAKEVIKAAGRDVIEVFGVGSSDTRDVKSSSKITIDRMAVTKGKVGTSGSPVYQKQPNGTYNKYKNKTTNYDVNYEIRWFTSTTEYERKIAEMMFDIFDVMCYINTWNTAAKSFSDEQVFIEYISSGIITREPLIESMARYTVRDMWLDPVLLANVPALTSIQIDLNLKDK